MTGCEPVLMPIIGMVMSWKNACTTVETVIHKSPSNPPRACRIALDTMMMTLSVAMMRKGEMPSLTIFPINLKSHLPRAMRIFVFFHSRKVTTNAKDKNCERTVAKAAPATSMRKTKMNSGSSAMFAAAPITVVSIPMPEYPCAVIYWFSPVAVMEKTAPAA